MPYRHKSRFNEKWGTPGTWDGYNCATDSRVNGGPCDQYKDVINEQIAYEVGNEKPSGTVYRRMNNCRHLKTKIQHFPSSIVSSIGTDSYQSYYKYNNCLGSAYTITEGSLVAVVEPTSEEIRSLNGLAFDAMYPSLEGDVQLTNFVLELRDFSRLWELVSRWKGLFRKGAESHIGYNFGIKPFVSDVKDTYQSLMDYRQRIDDFIERADTVQRRHFRKKLDEEENTYYVENLFPGRTVQRKDESVSVFHATLVYKYEVPKELRTTLGRLNAIRDMVGLRFGLSEIWEAIPFSFVVDWFIPIQQFLGQFSQPLIKPKLTVIDYCYSFKSEVRSKVWGNYCDKCVPGIVKAHTYATAISKVYERRKCLPETGTYFVPETRFGTHQLALSSSLLILAKRR